LSKQTKYKKNSSSKLKKNFTCKNENEKDFSGHKEKKKITRQNEIQKDIQIASIPSIPSIPSITRTAKEKLLSSTARKGKKVQTRPPF